MLQVITGCMFSGKSEELIRLLKRARYAKHKVVAIKPQIDDRYSAENIVSHNGGTFQGLPLSSVTDIQAAVKDYDVVGIEEAQFFGNGLIPVVDQLLLDGKTVIVAGLDMDSRGQPWEPMPYFMATADTVTKQTAICMVCGQPATRSQRLIVSTDQQIQVGGSDAYEARCRGHWHAA